MRLKSIQKTKQITESMRLISTRKVQKTRIRLSDSQPYFEQCAGIVNNVVREPRFRRHRYITGHKYHNTGQEDSNNGRGDAKALVILITGDRGFCGGYNTNVSKEAYHLIQKSGDPQIIAIGIKGRDYLQRRQMPAAHVFKGLSENPFHEDARNIGDIAVKMYGDGTVDEVYLVYTENETMLIQTPRTIRLLPVDPDDGGETGYIDFNGTGVRWVSDDEAYMQYAISAYTASMLFHAMLESAVCEQCARVMSMDSAVKNADRMIESLTIQYNQMRQGDVTREIAEIVGGANVVNSK
jgi:F-type H+-transporting ATPase subunit gamma